MNLALFDFDGTLTDREMLPVFVLQSVPRLRLAWGRVLLAPWVLGYRCGWISASRMRAAIAWVAWRGVSRVWFERAAAEFAERALDAVLRPEAVARLEWHRARGDRIVVVSGGYAAYLRPWAARHGLEVLASELEVRADRLTGRYAGLQCVGAEKARRVRAHCDLKDYPQIYAYGDTPEDEDLLALADVAVYQWQDARSPQPASG